VGGKDKEKNPIWDCGEERRREEKRGRERDVSV
jgi:hypothetical protein